jgi:NAD(P)-dependent dehydrogenase (short-subunit alcohol dehydrogenase family)
MGEFTGRVALVTGAAGGIGREVAGRLADLGAHVLATDLPETERQELEVRLAGRGAFCPLDVSDEAAWTGAIADAERRFGPLDFLVNVAGYFRPYLDLEHTSLDEWRRHFAINVEGTFLGCKHGIASMKKGGRGGAIVNVSSGLAWKRLKDGFSYCISKATVLELTRLTALHAASYGIRVNAMLPGAIDTPMMWRNLRPDQTREALEKFYAAQHPIGRIGNPGDIAGLVEFLCSERSSFITGACIPIDGGQTL